MHVKDKTSFQSGRFYNLTTNVQENTLLNRGLVDIGGCAIPQALMSNNRDEAIERGTMSTLYFSLSFFTPFLLLPKFNKAFLKSEGIVKDFTNNEKRIIEVSKKYLAKDGEYLVEGVKKFADNLLETKNVDVRKDFDNILNRFPDKEVLRQKLANAHSKVFKYDFLSTSWMWCATPWVTTEMTERRTNKKGFSAAFNLSDHSEKIDEKKYKESKRNRMIATALIATIPALIAPVFLKKGILGNFDKTITSNNPIKKGYGNFMNGIKKNASNFDYKSGMFMSKTIFALMWALCDYPSSLVSARDNYERKDRAIRLGALFVMFFGGDFALNNIGGRLLDKFAKTKIMDTDKLNAEIINGKMSKTKEFFKRFTLSTRKFSEIDTKIKASPEILKRTKNVGAGLYWFSLLANMGLIGFALPASLNKMLKNSLKKDIASSNPNKNNAVGMELDKKSFSKLGF